MMILINKDIYMFITRIIGRTAASVILLGLVLKIYKKCKRKKSNKQLTEENDLN